MSRTYSLVCDACKEKLWIAQAHGANHHIYTTDKHAARHADFLFKHMGHSLKFEDDETVDDEYTEFEESEA